MKNLVKAVLAVMGEVENIDKNMTVGAGTSSYQGVSDKDVKHAIGKAMKKHGLVLFPIEIDPTLRIERWEEETFYNGQKSGVKVKQSVFTEVKTKYLLMHESGESQIIEGYGHGVDAQDKSAGKASTYALKNTLLYTFLVPTGSLEDTDKTHSEDIATPNKVSSKSKVEGQTPIGISPGLPKVINEVSDIDGLNTIWKNNKALHDNAVFRKLIAIKKLSWANSAEEVATIFENNQILHTDQEFVSQVMKRKKEIVESDALKSA